MHLFKLNLSLKKKLKDTDLPDDVDLTMHLSFYTSGQVKYNDTAGCPKIVEFNGTSWSINLLLKKDACTDFSAFILNPKKLENQIVTLTKKINANISNHKTFELSINNFYDGWFKLEN